MRNYLKTFVKSLCHVRQARSLLLQAWKEGKVIAAVCHGPAALVSAQTGHLLTKHSILKGKRVTGFSNLEEEQVDKTKDIPFLLEDRIGDLGGLYEKAEKPWEVSLIVVSD